MVANGGHKKTGKMQKAFFGIRFFFLSVLGHSRNMVLQYGRIP